MDIYNVDIDNSYATGSVKSNSQEYSTSQLNNAGGLVGTLDSNSTIINSYASGAVVSSEAISPAYTGAYAGGLLGGTRWGNVSISNSYAAWSVSPSIEGTGTVGSLVGGNDDVLGSSATLTFNNANLCDGLSDGAASTCQISDAQTIRNNWSDVIWSDLFDYRPKLDWEN